MVEVADHPVRITIPIEEDGMKQHNNIVSDYFFEVVVVQGDVMKDNGRWVDNVESQVYQVGDHDKQCVLSVDLPMKKVP